MMTNIIFLLAMTFYLSETVRDKVTNEPTNNNHQGLIIQLQVWVAFSVMCLIYFVVFKFQPSNFMKLLETDSYDVWMGIGFCILTTRMMILVAAITRYNMVLSRECYAVQAANDNGFQYVFMQMLIDTVQTFTFSLIPFPWPWSIYLCAIEFTSQLIRMGNCGNRISSDPAYHWVAPIATSALVSECARMCEVLCHARSR